MTKEEARQLLFHHAFMEENVAHAKSEVGFLRMLRPFNGVLVEENYHEIMGALKVLADDLARENVDRSVVSALWGICHLARCWATHPEGMLRSNNLITEAQVEKIASWIDDISYATMLLLEGAPDEAFHQYNLENP